MTSELVNVNYLTENGVGGYNISASALTSWSRCQLQRFYDLRARQDPDAPQPRNLSATVYGSVMHYALMILEQAHHEGRDDAFQVGLKTFEHYWQVENLPSLGLTIDEWLPRQTWSGLKARGQQAMKDYYRLLKRDDGKLLALEYHFEVPIEIRGRVHTLQGQIDRMSLRKYYNKPYLALEDFKTGKQPSYLRYNMQGTVYAYVTTRREFWSDFPPETVEALERSFASYGYDLFPGSGQGKDAARRFRWVNVQEIKFADGGWRSERDYARMELAIDAYVRGNEAGVFSVNTTGEVCRHCDFRRVCGGVGLPDEKAGAP